MTVVGTINRHKLWDPCCPTSISASALCISCKIKLTIFVINDFVLIFHTYIKAFLALAIALFLTIKVNN